MPSADDEWTDYKQRRENQIYKLCVVKSDLSIMLDSLEIPISGDYSSMWRIMEDNGPFKTKLGQMGLSGTQLSSGWPDGFKLFLHGYPPEENRYAREITSSEQVGGRKLTHLADEKGLRVNSPTTFVIYIVYQPDAGAEALDANQLARVVREYDPAAPAAPAPPVAAAAPPAAAPAAPAPAAPAAPAAGYQVGDRPRFFFSQPATGGGRRRRRRKSRKTKRRKTNKSRRTKRRRTKRRKIR